MIKERRLDIIGWDQSNQAYVLTHGVSRLSGLTTVMLREYVYDVYMTSWGDVVF